MRARLPTVEFFFMQAAARLRVTIAKLLALHDCCAAAITSAKPVIMAFALSCGLECCQSSKMLVRDINESAHDGLQERLLREVAGPVLPAPVLLHIIN